MFDKDLVIGKPDRIPLNGRQYAAKKGKRRRRERTKERKKKAKSRRKKTGRRRTGDGKIQDLRDRDRNRTLDGPITLEEGDLVWDF